MINTILLTTVFQIIITFFIIFISKKKKLLDIPDKRKAHTKPTPYTGGLIISITYLFIVFITDYKQTDINLILSYLILAALAGLVDDIYDVNPGTKLVLQTFPILILINQNLFLVDLGEYRYLGTITLGSFDKIFTIFCCLFLVNACNYADGIDGLLSSISVSIIISLYLFIKIFTKTNIEYLLIITFPFIIFFFFNITNTKLKIFLGDSGSNLSGFLISFLSITAYTTYGLSPSVIIWPLAYVVFDFLIVNINRLIYSNKIFEAGKDHFHYELMKKFNLNSYQTLVIVLLIQCFITLFGLFICMSYDSLVSVIFFIIFFIIFFFFKNYIRS